MMTSVWPLVWVICGLTVWFPHTHAASLSPILLMTTSAPTTEEQSTEPEHQTDPTDPSSNNNTASLSPILLMTTSAPSMEQQSTEPEYQTDFTDPSSNNNTASLSPILLMTTSAPSMEQQSTEPEYQTDFTDPSSNNNTASLSPILLMTTSAQSMEEQSTNPEHQTYPTDPSNHNNTASLSPILLMTTSAPSTEEQSTEPEHQTDSTEPSSNNNTGRTCMSLLPPRRGSYYVEHGTGVSVGSMLVFWCREGYQLVGHEKITCILKAGTPQWSSYLPVCESIPRPNDQGLRIALLVSIVSGVVILLMSVFFIICCCQEHISKKREKQRTGRSRRREKRSSRSHRSPSWLQREQLDWEAFPPPKLFNLSQRLDRPLPPGSPVYSEVVRAYENRGYERSQESLLRSPHTTYPTYQANSQIYPALVFQRVQTGPNPTTSTNNSVYVQISTPPKNKTTHGPSVTHP
ncbi:uncharacterized protein LOC127456402 isoform X1 [Myxocyprinus asiaticus]|uniref:uncharacterized protein LOC127456402 isoform X1 n=1 Tax=Myxocyprinus asiaticus TaxID=70543 RepID=UPI0022235916|nr:uncharacterized protein LOC127456402 isoform X1 [Myxocyprinus asiaticus]